MLSRLHVKVLKIGSPFKKSGLSHVVSTDFKSFQLCVL